MLWVSGCEHHCKNCHNKFSWDKNIGQLFTDDTLNNIKEYLKNDYVSGITFSGGDPLAPFNILEVTNIVKEIKKEFGNTKTVWLYTGYTLEEIKDKEILKYIDVLVDGRYVDELRDLSLPFRGSKNQRILYRGKDF